ncbi:MAG: laminin B domain-containing protein [Gemmataceae bacterium]
MKSRSHVRLGLETLEDRATPSASSLFTNGLEGWTTVREDGKNAGANALLWKSPGGHPGGFIQATDKQDGHRWYWVAPAKFQGDQSDTAGTFLTFDQKVTVTTRQFNYPDVYLSGGGVKLQLDMPKNPAKTWTAYAVQLSPTGGWKVKGTNRAPTADEFRAVLASVTDLAIRGEYTSDKSTGGLDNVVLGDSAPKLTINSVSRAEGRSGKTAFNFTVALSHIMPTAASVHYSTSDGTATAGSDYVAILDAVVNFKAGETSKTVTVQAKGDRAKEQAETFTVNLASASPNVTIGQGTGTGTILNDD